MADTVEPVPRKPRGRNVVETAAVAATSIVPVIGGPFSVVLGSALQGAYQRRLLSWFDDLAEAMNDLADRVDRFEPSELLGSEDFLETALRAARVAGLTTSGEKREALKAAVLNSALSGAPDEDQQQIFISFIEDLTASHLRLLALLNDPPRYTESLGITWPDTMMGGHSGTVERAFPEWDRAFYDQLARDLHSRGLIRADSLHTTVSGNGLRQSQTTESGKRFLAFITAPKT